MQTTKERDMVVGEEKKKKGSGSALFAENTLQDALFLLDLRGRKKKAMKKKRKRRNKQNTSSVAFFF